MVFVAAIALGSCGNKPKEERHTVEEEGQIIDSSMFVRLLSFDNQDVTIQVLKTGKKQKYSYAQAKFEGQVKGDLRQGDTLSIFPETEGQRVRSMINVSELVGQWFFDMEQHRGVKFGHFGALSSINMQGVSFRNWFVKNGQLIIDYVDMQEAQGNGRKYWVDHSRILSLSKDEFSFSFRDSVYQCRHQKGVIKMKFKF